MMRLRKEKTNVRAALPEDDSEVEDSDIPVRKRSEDDEVIDAPAPKRGPIGVKDMPGPSDQEQDDEEGEEGEEEDEEEEDDGDDEV
jgi:hypothetical protein